jgi:hypothetical protein
VSEGNPEETDTVQEYRSSPGEWALEGVPVNVVGYRR